MIRILSALLLLLLYSQPVERIALIGCHRQQLPAPALLRYVEAQPDLCLCNVYADTRDNPAYIDSCYALLAAKPGFVDLMRHPYMAT